MSPLLLLLILGGGIALAAGASAGGGGDQSSQSPQLSAQPNVLYLRPVTDAEVTQGDREFKSFLASRGAISALMIFVDDAGEAAAAPAIIAAAQANPTANLVVLNVGMRPPELVNTTLQAAVLVDPNGSSPLQAGMTPTDLAASIPQFVAQTVAAGQA